jgi:hypothetical protein
VERYFRHLIIHRAKEFSVLGFIPVFGLDMAGFVGEVMRVDFKSKMCCLQSFIGVNCE